MKNMLLAILVAMSLLLSLLSIVISVRKPNETSKKQENLYKYYHEYKTAKTYTIRDSILLRCGREYEDYNNTLVEKIDIGFFLVKAQYEFMFYKIDSLYNELK